MTYSTDFRQKVLLLKEQEKLNFAEAALRFGVSKASIVRWSNRLELKRTREKPWTKIDREKLLKDIEVYPDAYQYERALRLAVSRRGIGDALKRLGVSRKKNTVASESKC